MTNQDFYKYPKNFETRQYALERKIDGFHVVYEVRRKTENERLGSIEIDLKTREVRERSGWRDRGSSEVKEEVKEYLRRFF